MSGARMQPAKIDELVRRCLDGTATAAEAALLDEQVATSPQAARTLAEAARWESLLDFAARDAPEELWRQLRASAEKEVASSSRHRGWIALAGFVLAGTGAAMVAFALSTSRGVSTKTPIAVQGDRGTALQLSLPAPHPPTSEPPREAPKTPTELHFADGSVARLLGEESRVENRRSTARAIDVAILRGGARFDVVHRSGRRFKIWVASAYVEVVGTVFSVQRLPEGMRVSVERGAVRVVSGRHRTRLSAGTSREFSVADARDRDGAGVAKRPAETKAPVRPDDQAGALLRASEHARTEGRPEEALTLLRRFLDDYRSDPRAPYAGFIIGRVLLEELNRPREAAIAFARVGALNPHTPLMEDALAREVESWFRADEFDHARERANAFLTRYPQSGRAAEVRGYGRIDGHME